MTRKGELEIDLTRARGTDFGDASVDQVSVGNKLVATNLESNKEETFVLLGAWDGDPDNQILSYLLRLAKRSLERSRVRRPSSRSITIPVVIELTPSSATPSLARP